MYNYYSFILQGVERIYYTTRTLNTEQEITEWAIEFNFIKESDVSKCKNIRSIPTNEVERRNKELYKIWWEKHKNDNTLSGKTPPTIGEVQLD